jgi:hypothetical protein
MGRMWLALSSLIALALCAALYTLYARSRKLRGLSGPPSPSFFVGNTVDLRRAPTGTRFKVWQRAYGATYKITGPLLVSVAASYVVFRHLMFTRTPFSYLEILEELRTS